jgi:hypothetical protein
VVLAPIGFAACHRIRSGADAVAYPVSVPAEIVRGAVEVGCCKTNSAVRQLLPMY